jgi:agmatinase
MPDVAMPAFLGLTAADVDPATAFAAILPVPYDGTSTWMKGADAGPRAILEASAAVELYDIETDSEPWRRGIVTCPPVTVDQSPEAMAAAVERAVAGQLELGRLPIVLGGEHSVTIGAVRAVRARYDDLTVLQIDAHADTRESYEGSTHNHACVMARARECCPIVQVGIRSVDAAEIDRLDQQRVFWAHEIVDGPDRGWMDRVAERCTGSVYVTVDLDGLDPSVIPATGTPEPGGLSWADVNELIRRVAAAHRIVGYDVVELLPMPGHHASAFTAAKLVYRMLATVLARRR